MTLKDALAAKNISVRKLGRLIGVSKTSAERIINHGQFPARANTADLKRRIIHALSLPSGEGIEWPAQREIEVPQEDPLQEIDLMQLDRSVMQLFGLRANPFINDVETDADVLRFRGYDGVEQAIKDTIEQRGFLAGGTPPSTRRFFHDLLIPSYIVSGFSRPAKHKNNQGTQPRQCRCA